MVFQIKNGNGLPKVHTDAYSVLEHGRFLPGNLRLHVQGGRKSYSPEIRSTIEQSWKDAEQDSKEHGRSLFNRKLFSLKQYQVRQGTLNLLLGETDYQELLGTNFLLPGEKKMEEKDLSDGIAVCTTIITKDRLLALGKRGHKVQKGRGMLHVCAGHPDPDRLLTPERMLTGENLLFTAMKSEMKEEFNISADKISGMACLGLIRDSQHHKPEAVFQTEVKISSKQLLKLYESAKDKDEHEEIFTVPSEQKELIDFLNKHHQEFTAPGLAAIILYGVGQGFWSRS
jgi:hypothetical protein